MQDYSDKPAIYFGNPRQEIEPLLPPAVGTVLDIGCGAGATLQWLRGMGRVQRTVGIELAPHVAQEALSHADAVHVGPAESLLPEVMAQERPDLVLCLDVLEHLSDPWQFVAELHRLMSPGASLIASVPNVRHLRVLLPLLLLGRWRYEDSGILDRTHLRFFTRESALALLTPPGLSLVACRRRMPPWHAKTGLLNLLSAGLARDLVAISYLIAVRKA